MLKAVAIHSLVCVMTSIHNQNIFSQPPPKYYHRIWLYKEMGLLLGGERHVQHLKEGIPQNFFNGYVPPNGVVILGTHFRDVP